jgi:hypothetical protein
MKQNAKQQERQEVASEERDSKVKRVKEALVGVLAISGSICTWAALRGHQTIFDISLLVSVVSALSFIVLAITPPKQLSVRDSAQIPPRALAETPKPNKIVADAQPESRVFEKENTFLKIEREHLLDEIDQTTGVKHEKTPLPTPEPAKPTEKQAGQQRLPLVAPPLLTPGFAQDTQNSELIGEELTDDQRLILSALYRCGGSLYLYEFTTILPIARRSLELRIEELREGKYCSLDRFGGNQTRKTKLVIERNGELFGRQEQSPFPVRPFDPLPAWASQDPPHWTHYTKDNMLGDRLLWVWHYDTRVNDGHPRDLNPFCPECKNHAPLSGQQMFFQQLPKGLFINRLICPYHSDRPPYDVVGDIQNGEYSSIMRRIIINIRNGGWMIAERRQRGIRL